MSHVNPYWGADFFHFFSILFQRLWAALGGGDVPLAADELQLAVLSLVALSCGLIGPFLVLKKMAMFANSLSHTILLGISVSFLIASRFWGADLFDLSTLLLGSLAAALLTAFLTEALIRLFHLQEDASLGLVFTALFALGILLITLYTRNVHLGVEAVMGNADALRSEDLKLPLFLAFFNAAAIAVFYRRLQLCSFDPQLASTLGISTSFFHFLLLFLAALTILAAFRAIGILLVLSFLIGPYLTARLFLHRLPHLLVASSALGIFASLVGVALARHLLSRYGLALSTGGLVVLVVAAVYLLALFLRAIVRKIFFAPACAPEV